MGRLFHGCHQSVPDGAIHIACSPRVTRPKFPPDESLSIPSVTLTDEQFLRGDTADGVP